MSILNAAKILTEIDDKKKEITRVIDITMFIGEDVFRKDIDEEFWAGMRNCLIQTMPSYSLPVATGKYLDRIADNVGVCREYDESDKSYRDRIMESIK